MLLLTLISHINICIDRNNKYTRVRIVIINENIVTNYKLTESCSIFTTEVIAILKTVEHMY